MAENYYEKQIFHYSKKENKMAIKFYLQFLPI